MTAYDSGYYYPTTYYTPSVLVRLLLRLPVFVLLRIRAGVSPHLRKLRPGLQQLLLWILICDALGRRIGVIR